MHEQRETLREQSKDELIDSIFEMQARMSQLEKRLAELEAKRKRKTAKNSSTPPSRSPKANPPQKQPAKRGPKPGHPGRSRANAEPDVIVECRVETCPECGHDLSVAAHRQVSRSQTVDIPPIQPQVVEARRYSVTCPGCATTHQADYPQSGGIPTAPWVLIWRHWCIICIWRIPYATNGWSILCAMCLGYP